MKEPEIIKNSAFKPFCKKCKRMLTIRDIETTDSSGKIKCKYCGSIISN